MRMPRPPLKWALCPVPPPPLSPGKGRVGFRIPERIVAGCLSLPHEVSGVPQAHRDVPQPKMPPKRPPGVCVSRGGPIEEPVVPPLFKTWDKSPSPQVARWGH